MSVINPFLLFRKYTDVGFIFVHSEIDVRSRGDLVHYMQSDYTTNDQCKILISVFQLMGMGHNLYRASHVILLEQPKNQAIQMQATGRVSPGSQAQDRAHDQLYDGQSLPETVLRIRILNEGGLIIK